MHQNSYQTIVAGVVLVRNAEGKYLFLKRSAEEHYGAGLWDLPGGAKEFLETPKEGALRECKEESGIDAEQAKLIWHFVKQGHNEPTVEFVCFVYQAQTANQQVELSNEHNAFQWLSIEEAKSLQTVHWLQDFFHQLEQGTITL